DEEEEEEEEYDGKRRKRRKVKCDENGDEILEDDGEFLYVKRKRIYHFKKTDFPPENWLNEHYPHPFWSPKVEKEVIRKLDRGESYCDITADMQVMYWKKGTSEWKECYQVKDYCVHHKLFPVKQEYDDEVDLRESFRQQLYKSWRKKNAKSTIDNKHRLLPCSHSGRCEEQANPPCRCHELKIPCTKLCLCDVRCRNRFPGCRCAPGKCRTRQCQCYFASWECDPDTCKSCGCVRDHPQNRSDLYEKRDDKLCPNVAITIGMPKLIYSSKSEIAGYGAFIGEDVKKGEFVVEYVGEIISVEEAERRGRMYDKLKLSYTFTLNDDEVVDATRAGNIARFINHSNYPNCSARVWVVQGDHRIGIVARRDLKKGEELFFNYGYSQTHKAKFTNKEREGIDVSLLDLPRQRRKRRGEGEGEEEDSDEEEEEEEE
ncbi:hypothetical protein PFISCL1PPCAC_5504, partial [Pristionchus fissidentatus]